MLILFHITFGVFIISDSLFGLENPPKTYNNTVSNTIANILHNFMIASAGIQAGGVVSGIVAHFTKE
ncbi:hypothetical protein H4217_006862 [Coemansia sp. RSA 1939]|nr:hypothetical protein H4217_006862 [Coemansia sp. RSA 1939]